MSRRVFTARRTIVFVLFGLILRAGLATSPTLVGGDQAVAIATPVAATPAPAPAAVPAEPAPSSAGIPEAPVPHVDGMPIPAERLPLRPVLVQVAQEYGLPKDLVLAQAWAESSSLPTAGEWTPGPRRPPRVPVR
jgi:hypothetical protein